MSASSPPETPFWAKPHLWTFVYIYAWVGYWRERREKESALLPTYLYVYNMYVYVQAAPTWRLVPPPPGPAVVFSLGSETTS